MKGFYQTLKTLFTVVQKRRTYRLKRERNVCSFRFFFRLKGCRRPSSTSWNNELFVDKKVLRWYKDFIPSISRLKEGIWKTKSELKTILHISIRRNCNSYYDAKIKHFMKRLLIILKTFMYYSLIKLFINAIVLHW